MLDVAMARLPNVLATTWQRWNLARQFLTCASLVLLPAMLSMGWWVSSRIEESASQMAGTSAALYMDNFVEPLIQDLARADELSVDSSARLSRLLSETSLGSNVLWFKIWTRDGRIIASNRAGIVGQRFEPSPRLQRAWRGIVTVEYNSKGDSENTFERETRIPLLEVYVPLRARGTDRMIAVGEFYVRAHLLRADLARAKVMSWLVVAGITLAMLSALFAIVRHGSRTIVSQQQSLRQRVDQLTRLLDENQRLRLRVNRASARSAESAENYLRRLGADLHDGPAQLVSLALLRVADDSASDGAARGTAPSGEARSLPRASTRSVLEEALRNIRNIAAGLALPEIDELSLRGAIALAIRRHEELTGTAVEARIEGLPEAASQALKLCAYRIVQEGLSNAFRHAGGTGQSVIGLARGDTLQITVADKGPGCDAQIVSGSKGLGLQGLTDRVESLGGHIDIASDGARGTRLVAELPLRPGESV